MLTIEIASNVKHNLTMQALRNKLLGADGKPLQFKIMTTTEDKRVKARFEVLTPKGVDKC